MGQTRITVDGSKCGNATGGIDPRTCSLCLRVCDPAVFLRHGALGVEQPEPRDPQYWQVTAVWLSLCTRCGKCVKVCPEKAIKVLW